MGHKNPSQVLPIYTCGRHENSNIENTKVSPLLLLRRQGYFILFVDVHLQSGEQVSRTIILSDPAPKEGK
jgi:hypothetical protein